MKNWKLALALVLVLGTAVYAAVETKSFTVSFDVEMTDVGYAKDGLVAQFGGNGTKAELIARLKLVGGEAVEHEFKRLANIGRSGKISHDEADHDNELD